MGMITRTTRLTLTMTMVELLTMMVSMVLVMRNMLTTNWSGLTVTTSLIDSGNNATNATLSCNSRRTRNESLAIVTQVLDDAGISKVGYRGMWKRPWSPARDLH